MITVLGPEYFLLVHVPPDVVELPDYEQFLEVGAIARVYFNDPKRRLQQVAGYRFRHSLDEVFVFPSKGNTS